jgi:sulfate/thiosulfate transport system substrate-binding protein
MRSVRKLPLVAALSVVIAALAVAACGSSSKQSSSGGSAKLTLVAYSTPKDVYASIIPAFQKTPAGNGVTFDQSYGGSGEQSRAVLNGLAADVVAFSLSPDINRLAKAGLVDANWKTAAPHGANVSNSVVVLAVRKGNPKHIKSWDDLVKPGIQVVTPNPFTSGGARWNVMAAYGAQIKAGKSPAQAQAYLKKLFKNVAVQDKSAREALQTFTGGKGDVLLAYENEAIGAQQKGQSLDYVIPDRTLLIETPAAVLKNSKHPEQAKAFLDYLFTPQAQKVFAAKGYRSVDSSLVDAKQFPTPPGLFKISDFGGWTDVSTKFFDPQNGIVAKIEQGQGVSIASK